MWEILSVTKQGEDRAGQKGENSRKRRNREKNKKRKEGKKKTGTEEIRN